MPDINLCFFVERSIFLRKDGQHMYSMFVPSFHPPGPENVNIQPENRYLKIRLVLHFYNRVH